MISKLLKKIRNFTKLLNIQDIVLFISVNFDSAYEKDSALLYIYIIKGDRRSAVNQLDIPLSESQRENQRIRGRRIG